MIVGINALSARAGGGRVYLQNLVRSLSEVRPNWTIDVVLRSADQLSDWPKANNLRYSSCPANSPLLRVLFEGIFLFCHAHRNGWDIGIFPNGVIPILFRKAKTAIIIQNQLIWDRRSVRDFKGGYQRLRHFLLRRSCICSIQRADKIIYVSNFIKAEAEKAANPKTARRSAVIYLGLEKRLEEKAPPQAPNGRFVFYPSPIFPYKRQLTVLDSFTRYIKNSNDPELFLVFGGGIGDRSYFRKVLAQITKDNLQERVLFVGDLKKEEMQWLLKRAEKIVFASVCESISLIVLEAIASGRPFLCSSRSPMPEIAGPAASYFDPDSPEELCQLLSGKPLLISEKTRTEVLSKFSWTKNAIETAHLIEPELETQEC